MLAKILTCAVVGLEGAIVEVEVDISPGQMMLTIVGLPDASVQEAKERAQGAPGQPSVILGASFRCAGSPSTWRRPTSRKRARPTICR